MLQHVLAAYQRITHSIRKPVTWRRSVSLSVVALEERATPAANLAAPIQPETVLMAAMPPAAVAPAAGVRSDLFGVGGAGTAVAPDELEAMLTSEQAARATAIDAAPVQTQTGDADGEYDGGAVIVENMIFLPRVE